MKNVLIAGGSDGLGRALAELLVGKYAVTILSNDSEKIQKVAAEIGCDFVVADISDYQQVEAAIRKVSEKHGSIDVLVNGAGIYLSGLLEDHDPAHMKRLIDVNVVGTMYLSHAVVPLMKDRKRGRIINVISQNGLSHKAERSVYTASKWAITGFTKCLNEDLIKHNISVSGFYPGLMRTKLFEKGGAIRDTTNSMDPKDAARAIEFMIEVPEGLTVPELGIKPSWY